MLLPTPPPLFFVCVVVAILLEVSFARLCFVLVGFGKKRTTLKQLAEPGRAKILIFGKTGHFALQSLNFHNRHTVCNTTCSYLAVNILKIYCLPRNVSSHILPSGQTHQFSGPFIYHIKCLHLKIARNLTNASPDVGPYLHDRGMFCA